MSTWIAAVSIHRKGGKPVPSILSKSGSEAAAKKACSEHAWHYFCHSGEEDKHPKIEGWQQRNENTQFKMWLTEPIVVYVVTRS